MKKLAEVRKRLERTFLQSLRLKRQALDEAISGVEDGTSGAGEAVRRLAHQLKGSCGSFGYPALSDVAGLVEAASGDELLSHAKTLSAEIFAVLERAPRHPKGGFRLLLVEDDPAMVALMRELLSDEGQVEVAVDLAAARTRLQSGEPLDLCLLDLALPSGDGRELLASLQDRTAGAMPVIVVSAYADSVVERECLALGADYVVSKPLDPERLLAVVRNVLTRRRAPTGEFDRDPLTGLRTRRALESAFEEGRAALDRAGSPVSIALLDIDRFKDVNDGFGHAAGNQVLRNLAEAMTDELRVADVVGRWGGDEFVALLPHTSLEGASVALRKVQAALRSRTLATPGGPTASPTLSIGIAPVDSAAGLDQAVARADAQLLRAKRAGRNVIVHEGVDVVEERQAIVVEDVVEMAHYICELLASVGFRTQCCHSGEQAVELATAGRCDLVVLDAGLPGMSGFDVAQILRADPRTRRVPIVMLTGRDDVESLERAFAIGIDDFVTKPFEWRELRARIRRLVER